MSNRGLECWRLRAKKCVLEFYTFFTCGIDAVVSVVGSHLCGWGLIPVKRCSFFIVMGLITVLHVSFSMQNTGCSFLLDYGGKNTKISIYL